MKQDNKVFPMRVGMNRYTPALKVPPRRVPHACGDEPERYARAETLKKCSPCVWG